MWNKRFRFHFLHESHDHTSLKFQNSTSFYTFDNIRHFCFYNSSTVQADIPPTTSKTAQACILGEAEWAGTEKIHKAGLLNLLFFMDSMLKIWSSSSFKCKHNTWTQVQNFWEIYRSKKRSNRKHLSTKQCLNCADNFVFSSITN